MRLRIVFIFLVFFGIFLSASLGVATQPMLPQYLINETINTRIENSLEINMTLISKDKNRATVMVAVKSLVGTLKDMELWCLASGKGMDRIFSTKLQVLQEGQQEQFEINVPKTALNKKSEFWLRFVVTYLPDYAVIRQQITADKKIRPGMHPSEKDQLARLKQIEENGKKSSRSISHDF